MSGSSIHSFRATIRTIGINRCVDVPERVSAALGSTAYIAVAGTADGIPFRTTLVPRGGGAHRMFLDGELRRRARVDTGDEVMIEMERDPEPREIAPPEDLEEALREHGLRESFERLTLPLRREIVRHVIGARRPGTRAGRIARVIESLRARRRSGAP